MASERDARRRACVDKAAAEVDSLAARGVRAGGNAFSEVLLVKGELAEAEKTRSPAPTARRSGPPSSAWATRPRTGHGCSPWTSRESRSTPRFCARP